MDSNKIEGKFSTVCVNVNYHEKNGNNHRIKTVFVLKNGIEVASIFKHKCKEVSLAIHPSICLTADTLEKEILPIMKRYDKFRARKEKVELF